MDIKRVEEEEEARQRVIWAMFWKQSAKAGAVAGAIVCGFVVLLVALYSIAFTISEASQRAEHKLRLEQLAKEKQEREDYMNKLKKKKLKPSD